MTVALDYETELSRAQACGWLQLFENSADAHGFPVELVLGIASRETDMQDERGDWHPEYTDANGVLHPGRYHGYGIMQVDIGTDEAFCLSWKPGMVKESIETGTGILAHKRDYLVQHGITDPRAIAAAYNTGEGNVMRSIRNAVDCDHTTEHGNYGTDVMVRAAAFKRLLGAALPT